MTKITRSALDGLVAAVPQTSNIGDVEGLRRAIDASAADEFLVHPGTASTLARTATIKNEIAEERGVIVPGWRDAIQSLLSQGEESVWALTIVGTGEQFLVVLTADLTSVAAILEVRG